MPPKHLVWATTLSVRPAKESQGTLGSVPQGAGPLSWMRPSTRSEQVPAGAGLQPAGACHRLQSVDACRISLLTSRLQPTWGQQAG